MTQVYLAEAQGPLFNDLIADYYRFVVHCLSFFNYDTKIRVFVLPPAAGELFPIGDSNVSGVTNSIVLISVLF